MANKVKGLAASVTSWIKKPWQITGPASTAEFLDAVPEATSYREISPATQPRRAIIPHAEPERVFDIKYYVRDTRRAAPTTTVLEVPSGEQFEGSAPAVNKFYAMGKEVSILDEPGEGYQK